MNTIGSRSRSARARGTIPLPAPDLNLAWLDEDLADLQCARELLAQGSGLQREDPRAAFEAVHRAALRGAGILVRQANRERRRKLPLNVWTALARIGGEAAERAGELEPLVIERARLERDTHAEPDPLLLRRHLEQTAAHLDLIGQLLVPQLPSHLPALAG